MNVLEKITEEELDFIEEFFYPPATAEILFHNFDNFGGFHKTKFGCLRHYQFGMISFEPIIDYESYIDLNEKEKFEMRQRVGDLLNVGARKTGKTVVTLRLDIILSILSDDGFPCALYALDEKRIRGVLSYVEKACKFHPVIKEWDVEGKWHPIEFVSKKTGWKLDGVNLTLKGKSPAENWFQHHCKKIWGEEVSFETRKCYEKRIEAVSELGAVFRLAGMTNFTKHSVIGKQFYDWLKEGKSLNLPQCVSPYWSEREKQERVKAYGSEDALNYKIYVEGKIVEDIVNELDMTRVEEQCYKRKESIKRFEIDKEKFNYYQNIIITERPTNAERIFITADVGDNQTEILIHSEVNNKYKYLYNITLYKLIKDEQEQILKFLIKELQANVIGVDCGDALGRVLCDDLEKAYSKENVVRYMGQSKIEVDFEKDDKDKIVFKDGKPTFKKELMAEWAVYLLKKNLYAGRHVIPFDGRLDEQFGNLVSRFVGNSKSTQCASEDDHLFNAWKVLEISIFLKKDFNKTLPMEEENPAGVMGFI